YGRGVGIIQATAAQLMNQFAKCLREKLAQEAAAAPPAAQAAPTTQSVSSPSIVPPPAPAAAKPISGFALIAKSIWSAIVGLFRRAHPRPPAGGMTGSSRQALRPGPACSVTPPPNTAAGRSRGSSWRNGPTPDHTAPNVLSPTPGPPP